MEHPGLAPRKLMLFQLYAHRKHQNCTALGDALVSSDYHEQLS